VTDRLLRPVAPLLLAGPDKAARGSVLVAADPARAVGTGGCYAKGASRPSSARSRDSSVIDQVYALTEERLSSFGT
jgi:hypothetical protein